MQKIKSRNVMFTFNSSKDWDLNLHLIQGNTHNFIIDTGLGADSVAPILEVLQGDDKPIVVINTHYHWDHIWGNGAFAGSDIISHRLCREIIMEKWQDMLTQNKEYQDGEIIQKLPNLIFEQSIIYPEDGVSIFYTPGHTVDCISVLDEVDKVLNVGDNIGDNADAIVPELDAPVELYRRTLLRYQTLDFDTCVSGHNIVLGKDVIERILGLM